MSCSLVYPLSLTHLNSGCSSAAPLTPQILHLQGLLQVHTPLSFLPSLTCTGRRLASPESTCLPCPVTGRFDAWRAVRERGWGSYFSSHALLCMMDNCRCWIPQQSLCILLYKRERYITDSAMTHQKSYAEVLIEGKLGKRVFEDVIY